MSSNIFISFAETKDPNEILFQSLLNEFQLIIHSCVGPVKGSFKLLTRTNDLSSSVLSSSSKGISSILYNLNKSQSATRDMQAAGLGFINWKFELIKALLNNCHFEHNYDSGLFLCHLINDFILRSESFYFDQLTNKTVIDIVLKNLHSHLTNQINCSDSLIAIKLNLENLNFLKKILTTLLYSKCLIQSELIETNSKDNFVNLCLKAFIKSFHGDHFSNILYLYNQNFCTHLNQSQLFDGVLFQTDSSQLLNQINHRRVNPGVLKCVLFESSLSGDFELLSDSQFQIELNSNVSRHKSVFLTLNKTIELFTYLIEQFQIQIILCQKVQIILK